MIKDLPKQNMEELLNSFPNKPLLTLKKRTTNGSQNTDDIQTITKTFSKEKWHSLDKQCYKRSISIFGFLLSLYAEVIANWSKDQEFSLLIRNNSVYDIKDDTLSYPLKLKYSQDLSFGESAALINKELQKQQRYSLNEQNPYLYLSDSEKKKMFSLFPVWFVNDDHPQTPKPVHTSESSFILACQIDSEGDQATLSWRYNTALIDGNLVNTMFAVFVKQIEKLLIDENHWNHHYFDLTPNDQLIKRVQVNETKKVFPDKLLHEPFIEMAETYPDNIAVIYGCNSITYAELKKASERLASVILQSGANVKDVVAIVMNKSIEQIISVLAVLLAGCVYLPISPELPEDRMKYLIKDTGARVALSHHHMPPNLNLADFIETIDVDYQQLLSSAYSSIPKQHTSTKDLAYIIYTSGSSGHPKGVMISHQAAFNTIYDINSKFKVTDKDKILALTDLSFDLSVYDIFGLLSVGGTIVVPNFKSIMFSVHWHNLLKKHKITIWNSVPSFMSLYWECYKQKEEPIDLRLTLLSGDWIPVNLPKQVKKINPNMDVISLGGATEASIWSIYYPIEQVNPEWTSIPYGKPLANQSFHILNKDMKDCPDQVTGELYIGGTGVADGYINNTNLTQESFIKHPKTGEIIYKTGDYGRYFPDGNIEFQGRIDSQVKISGFRIELEEIVHTLKKINSIKDAHIITYGHGHINNKLIAFIVKKGENSINVKEIRDTLKGKLPKYMIPHSFHFIDKIPLTSNGKIDRNYLYASLNFKPYTA